MPYSKLTHLSLVRTANSRANSTSTETEEIFVEENATEERSSEPIEIARPPSLQSILNEVGDLSGISHVSAAYSEAQASVERERIIQDMDRVDAAGPSTSSSSSDGIRNRRTYHVSERDYAEAGPSSRMTTEPAVQSLGRSDSTDLAANTENCTNENSENGNVIDESAVAAAYEPATASRLNISGGGDGSVAPGLSMPTVKGTEFRIKLKYLNDDLKLVKAAPSEHIGDFKK